MDFYANQRTRMRIVLLVLTLFGGRSASLYNVKLLLYIDKNHYIFMRTYLERKFQFWLIKL